jgi:CheY-like chemotaxis protein
MNLCVNAVEAMPEGGLLTLASRNGDDGWVEVLVEDNGQGMPREVLDRALEPFFSTKEVGKGTGLGLSEVRRTAQAHGGDLVLRSEPGRGTCVLMRFPACGTASEPGAEGSLPQAPGLLSVLVVDDDELIQGSLKTILELLGHRVTIASTGETALAMLGEGCLPDVVMLDMNMPGLGGAGTLPRLRALRPTLPVLIATGRVDQATLDLAEADPHVELLPKPFNLRAFNRTLVQLHLHA